MGRRGSSVRPLRRDRRTDRYVTGGRSPGDVLDKGDGPSGRKEGGGWVHRVKEGRGEISLYGKSRWRRDLWEGTRNKRKLDRWLNCDT